MNEKQGIISMEMVTQIHCHHLPGDDNPFFKLASLGDGEAFFKDSSLEMITRFSSSHLLEMMTLFSKIHLWRWIHGFQVIISGAFIEMVQRFSSSHLLEMVTLFQSNHLWHLYRDGEAFFKYSSLLHLWRWIHGFRVIISGAYQRDGEAIFKGSSPKIAMLFTIF